MKTVSHLFDCETLNIRLYLEVYAIRLSTEILPHDVCIILNRNNNNNNNQSSRA